MDSQASVNLNEGGPGTGTELVQTGKDPAARQLDAVAGCENCIVSGGVAGGQKRGGAVAQIAFSQTVVTDAVHTVFFHQTDRGRGGGLFVPVDDALGKLLAQRGHR
jgi:hypothetical protein